MDLLEVCGNNYILVDVGANLVNRKFSRDLESVVSRAKDAGIQKILVPGTSTKLSKESLRLAQLYPGTVYAAAGIHPYEAKSWESSNIYELREMLNNTECVAAGVCGLDYTKNFSPQDVQREVFEAQVALACELKKPLLLHEKGAHADMMNILNKYKEMLPVLVFHSFVGTYEEAASYLEIDNTYIGITGYFCKDNSDNGIQKLIESGTLPLNRILVQSDAPFSYPNSRSLKLPSTAKDTLTERSLMFLRRYCTFQRNEPCSLPIIVELIAGLLKKSPEEIALATTFTALKIFGFSS